MSIPYGLLKNQYFVLLLFLFLSVSLSNVSAEGEAKEPLRRIITSHGETFIFAHAQQQLDLRCPSHYWGKESHDVWWKGGTPLGNHNGYNVTQKGHLIFSSLTKGYAGTYTCTGINTTFLISSTNVTLIVDDLKVEDRNKTFPYRNYSTNLANGVQPIVKLHFSQSIDERRNVVNRVIFHCVASGWPVPRLFFLKDEQHVQATEDKITNGTAHSTLRLRYLQETDAGAYKCVAMNEIGDDVAYHIFHIIEPLRKITTSHGKRFIFAHVPQQLELECPVRAGGTASYVAWSKGSMSLGNQNGYNVTQEGLLVISSLTKENSGTYTCSGISGSFKVHTNITVIVDDLKVEDKNKTFPYRNYSTILENGVRPTVNLLYIFLSSENKPIVGDGANFHCISSGWPIPRLFFFKDEQHVQATKYKISNGTASSTLKLLDLKKTDAGAYKCVAINEMGDDVASRTLHVKDPAYPPNITSVWPTEVKIEEGSSTVFWCEVESSPGLKLTIKWLKILNKMESAEPRNQSNVISLKSGDVYYRILRKSRVIALEEAYKFKLTIENATIKNTGLYICFASNKKGSVVKHSTLLVKAKPSSSSPNFMQKHPELVNIMLSIALFIVVIGAGATTVCICKATKRCCTRKKKKGIALSADSVTKEECESLNQISTPSRITPARWTASVNNKSVKYTTDDTDDTTLQMHTILNNATPRLHTELLRKFPNTYLGISAPRYKTKLHWSSAYDDCDYSCSDFDFD